MKIFDLTAASQRAFEAAACWSASDGAPRDQSSGVTPVQLLLGLLAEPECRGAQMLAGHRVDLAAVRDRWPGVEPREAGAAAASADPAFSAAALGYSSATAEALLAAQLRLADFPRPLELATEHLVLGLVAGADEVADWLRGRGLDAQQLEEQIRSASGHASRRPLPTDELGPVDSPRGERADSPLAGSTETHAVWRIIDAAANRAGEGLRVVEDYVRFALDDRFLTAQCKALRHDLAAALACFPSAQRHAARETQGDVGTSLTLASEQARSGVRQVVAASFQRVEQALRSLEEYAKTIDPAAGARFESLRYRTYTLERALSSAGARSGRLAGTRLYVLIDGRSSVEPFTHLVDVLVAAGVDAIQLRDKRLADCDLIARARALRSRTRGTQTLFIMNDRPDLAVLAQADGVHVGQDELSVKDVRAVVGAEMLVGVSTHSLGQAQAAVLDGADYLGVGPTFPSGTKSFQAFPGLELLAQVSCQIALPAFAIGGINASNIAQVRTSGFTRVAVSGSVLAHADPATAVAELRLALQS